MAEPKTLMLSRLEQIRAFSDPLRQRILDLLCREALTTKQVADRLGEKPTRLYHHVAILERSGLVRLQRTRQNRGTTEKYFRAVADDFTVSPALFRVGARPKQVAHVVLAPVAGMLKVTEAEIHEGLESRLIWPGKRIPDLLAVCGRVQPTRAAVERLSHKVTREMLRMVAAGSTLPGVEYGITLLFYKVQRKGAPGAGGPAPRASRRPAGAGKGARR